MKFRKIIVATGILLLSSASFADNSGVMSQGGTYVGLAGGWGKISPDNNAVSFLNAQNDGGAGLTTGGFSGRVYLGYLMSFNASSAWLFGPELGYSYYANNTYTAATWNDDGSNLNIKQSAYGVDLLLNVSYMLNNTFNISIKPGIQYAFEKYSNNDDTNFFAASSNYTEILPEINIGATWQVFADKPFFVGASYQYVFGNSTLNAIQNMSEVDNSPASAASRDLLALNLEYMFH